MKNLIYLFIAASMMLVTACSDDDEYVFSELPSERIEAFQKECQTTLRGATDGWKLVYYPQKGVYGGFTLCFASLIISTRFFSLNRNTKVKPPYTPFWG